MAKKLRIGKSASGGKKQKVSKRFSTSSLIVLLFFFAISVIYLHNLTRDVYSGDIGDLVTAASVMGVAHPPGYPLFTFLGFLLTKLPFALPVVTKVALLSTIASIAALYFYYLLAFRFTKNLFLSLLSTSILAFSYLFWFHAEIPETFGLNNFFAVVILYYAILFSLERKNKYLYLLGFFGGLALTHHHTIVFIYPAVLILLLKHVRYILSNWKLVLFSLLCFLLGILPYLYVPIAASFYPVISWNSATNLNNFLHLLLRKDYGFAPSVVNEVPISVKLIHVSGFLKSLVAGFSYQIIAVGILGFFALVRRDLWLAAGITVAFLLAGPGFMYYAASLTGVPVGMGIIERFYVLPSVLFMFFVPFGFLAIKTFLETRFSRPLYTYLLLGYFLIIPVLLLYYNFPKTDLSKTTIGNTLADNIFSSVPKNAVLFVSGDTTTFNVWYNYYVLTKRRDIGLINPPGIGGNKYFEDEINEYYQKNPKAALRDLPLKTINELHGKKRIFATYQLPYLSPNTVLLPKGLVFEVVNKDAIPPKDVYLKEVEEQLSKLKTVRKETLSPSDSNLVAAEIPSIYATGLVRIGDFLDAYYKDPAKAEHYYRRALWLDPDHPNAYSGLALSQFKAYHDCRNAEENMRQAIELYPVWKTYYAQLYLIQTLCKKPQSELSKLEKEYQRLFHEDLKKVVAPRKGTAL